MDMSTATGILIDCPSGKHQAAIDEIEARRCFFLSAAIITHTHTDHSGGVLDVLEALEDRFYGPVFVNHESFFATPVAGPDRGVAGKQIRAIFHRLREYLDRVKPAEDDANGSCGEISWQILAPKHDEVLAAVDVGDSNFASAIVLLSAHGYPVLVGGDARLKTWQRIADRLPVGAVVRWPHHGGAIDETSSIEAQHQLFATARPSTVVISVGANNRFGHPSRVFFEARKESGTKLLCTQATSACVLGGGTGGRCAGSIRVTVTASGSSITVDAADHRAIIEAFGAAQCL
jgi:beta-lactamase superfamily II metal-dependent hydrolase